MKNNNLEMLAVGVLAAARVHFRCHLLKVWFAKLGPRSFKAYVIHADTKEIMESASSKESEFNALSLLRTKVSPKLSSARSQAGHVLVSTPISFPEEPEGLFFPKPSKPRKPRKK